jgi:gliding motility-associated-like protein
MKRLLLLFGFILAATPLLRATHNIAGEITVEPVYDSNGNCNYLTYRARVATYTNSLSPADRCELILDWGDGTKQVISRLNGLAGTCPPPATMGEDLGPQGYVNTKQNFYYGTHTYLGPSPPGGYIISIKDPNRVSGIDNIPNSVNVAFYLQTTIIVDPFVGCNSTPYLTTIPLDKACVNHCYYHNPGAVDPDGDSLAYSLGPCLDTLGNPIPGYSIIPATINAVTGDLSWCSPTQAGKYNIVIYIEEWKKFANGTRYKIGTVLRDMSIDVIGNCNNDNPNIPDLPDLCVDAGNNVNFTFTVTDPNSGETVKLQGFGSTFSATNPSTLTPSNSYLSVPFNATFNWNTTCEEARLQPWIVSFKATDNKNNNNSAVALTDLETVSITVVSPGPATLTATPQGTNMNLNWGQNPCNPVSNYCRGYKIYRRQGPSGWTPAQCETGVPSSTGFVQIGTLYGITNTNFIDNNNGAGLIPGVDYCYRVCAFFLDGAESYASPEACNELKRDVPVLTNVDVMSTGTNDQVFVRWVNAIPNGTDFDTLIHPGPWTLILERSNGLTFNSATAAIVGTFTSAIFTQLQTSFIDNGLNTVGQSYNYRLQFFAQNGTDFIGNCQPASSVYLYTTPSDNTVTLRWDYNTPWTNYEYAIYRFNTTSLLWDSIALAPDTFYVDDSLLNGVQYCYYVTAHGTYNNVTLPPVMYNRSQEACATPVDLTAPCAPNLTVNPNCDQFYNELIWTNPMNMNCGTDDVVGYQIYYAPVEGDPMIVIYGHMFANDTNFTFGDLFSIAGCYAITAVDTFNNQSPLSNIVCVDNCPEYSLPNVFTPNGDNINDLFIPFPYRYIESVDIRIYDRWGMLVFQSTDPAVRWDGRDMTTNKLCTDGVYYYTCIVNEIRLEGIVPRELKGFVHLFGKDVGQFN